MYVIRARNVNDAYYQGMLFLDAHGEEEDSRAGKVLVARTPVTTLFRSPMERVLFDPVRDANPFFHLMEALWMLAGKEDARWLDKFVSDFSARFAEEDGIQHGAYGYRWRQGFGFDQLDFAVGKLRKDPTSRQCVLQMWDCAPLGKGFDDLMGEWKDRPCNTHIYLRLRKEVGVVGVSPASGMGGSHLEETHALDLTVCCRSNDIIWGAYGANAVHFSVLQEYLAARIGVNIGYFYQISNNFHGYVDVLNKLERYDQSSKNYHIGNVKPTPIVTDPLAFDRDVAAFVKGDPHHKHTNPFFPDVARPMANAYALWRAKHRQEAYAIIKEMPINSDWRQTCLDWMARRMVKLSPVPPGAIA